MDIQHEVELGTIIPVFTFGTLATASSSRGEGDVWRTGSRNRMIEQLVRVGVMYENKFSDSGERDRRIVLTVK